MIPFVHENQISTIVVVDTFYIRGISDCSSLQLEVCLVESEDVSYLKRRFAGRNLVEAFAQQAASHQGTHKRKKAQDN